jgi:hypothetical protein
VLFPLNPELAIKFFLTFHMFTNAVAAMGTARHYHYVEAAAEGRVSVYTTFKMSREAYRTVMFNIVLVLYQTAIKIQAKCFDWWQKDSIDKHFCYVLLDFPHMYSTCICHLHALTCTSSVTNERKNSVLQKVYL